MPVERPLRPADAHHDVHDDWFVPMPGRARPKIDVDSLPTYAVPKLVNTTGPARAWLATGAARTCWALAVGIEAMNARSAALNAEAPTDRMPTFGAFGYALLVAAMLTGAWWTDARTRNVHLLEGRLPTRNRSIRAWLYPGIWILLMSVTLLRVGPHPDLDIRPVIIVLGFAVTVWRPYSLIRRLFTSLVRVRPDTLISTLGVIESVAFGLMWWQLVVWEPPTSPADLGRSEAMIGASLASALAFGTATILSYFVHRAANEAECLRILTLQTREEHRYLRSTGLNPHDAEVYRTLVELKQERVRRGVDAEDAAPPTGPVDDRPEAKVPAPAGAPLEGAGTSDRHERSISIRLHGLEASRYLVLVVGAGTTLGYAWIVATSLDLSAPVRAGMLSAADVARIDEARSVTVTLLSVWLPCITWWTFVVSRWGRRAGAPAVKERAALLCFAASVVAVGLARLADPGSSSGSSIGGVLIAAVIAAIALHLVMPVAHWVGRGRTALQIWAYGLPFLVGLIWIAGAHRTVAAGDPIEQLVFLGVIQGLTATVMSLTAAVVTLELQDELKVARNLVTRVGPSRPT